MRRKIHDISTPNLRDHAPYLAGLLDGEGSFMIINPKDSLTFTPTIALGMTHEATVAWVAKLLGVTYDFNEKREAKHKDVYVLRVNTQKECLQICQALYGYSITKKEPIKCMQNFLKLQESMPSYGTKRKESLLRIIDLFITCKKANHRGTPRNYEAIRKKLQKLVALQL